MMQTRRRFLATLSMAGAAALLRTPPASAVEGALETTTVRLRKTPTLCQTPQYIADELLRAEGFTDIRYVELPGGSTSEPLAHGIVDFDSNYASNFVKAIDAGEPITMLAGLHVGCFELFGNEGIHSITDLKGKSAGVQALGSNNYTLVAPWLPKSGSTPSGISTGSPILRPSRKTCSSTARSMRSSPFRRSRRSCAPAVSAR
jgi:NitT/TauT family transport system substrate-binding protein